MKTENFSRAAAMLLIMLLTTATAWATVKTVTYTYTDKQTLGGGKVRMTFTATGDISATYTVDVTPEEHSASFTLGDLHVSWESPETSFSTAYYGGWCIGGTAGYPDWTFTISSDNYYIDNVKYYNVLNELRMEKANDTKSCAITADNVAFGGYAFGIHAFTVVMSDSPAYAIHYELNGGYASGNANPAYYETTTGLTLTDATREYYNFGGWYDNAGLTGSAVTSIPAGTTGERTLYAKWTPVIYTISYVLNGGTNPANVPTSYTIETPTFNLPTPSRSGYYFRGWYLNEDFASAQWTQIKEGRHADFTFYAKWEEWEAEGNGTIWNPYKISSEEKLRTLATQVNGGDDCSGKYYQQTCDITITGGDWTPIGKRDKPFRGNYDGGNYTISGINISTTSVHQGLFGYVGGYANQHVGYIQNIILENSTIEGGGRTGGIVGYFENSYLQNCHARSSVTVKAASKDDYYGGIVGYSEAGEVSGCTSMATVDATGVKGGVIGIKVHGTAKNCFSFGIEPIGKGNSTNGKQVYQMRCTDGSITLPESVSDTDGFYYDGIGYYKKGVAVPLTVTLGEPAPGYALSVSYNDGSDHTIAPNADGDYLYTTTASDVTVKASIIPDPVHFSQSGDEYTIYTAEGWGVFCDALQDNATYNRFSGKTVKLGNDIEVSRMAGPNPFCGNFDGGNHTLTFNYTATGNYSAPFADVKGGSTEADATTISNLNVVTNITANDYRHTAGLIALQSGHVNVTGCNATVTITSTGISNNSHDLYPAALVSQASSDNGGTLTVSGCTATGTISTDGKYAAGLVGIVQGTATISDCLSSVTINSSTNGNGTHGGIVGGNIGATNIYGTVFNGRLLGTATSDVGGFIGWRHGGANIYNSLFIPAEVTVKTDNSATFARNDVDTHNCYYTYYLCDGKHYVPYYATDGITRRNGHAPLAVTAGDNVTVESVSPVGSPTSSDGYNGVYTVSGITAYAKGITRTVDDVTTFYYGAGDEVSLTLSNTATGAPLGYQYSGYTVSGGTLSGTTLTMPDDNVIINAKLTPIDWATESTGNDAEHAYMIYNKDQLDLLAKRVNNGLSDFSGKYFQLANDITYAHTTAWDDATSTENNYTAIGYNDGSNDMYFSGHFDGANHVISGIRIYKDDTDGANGYQGLFGWINNDGDNKAEVKNVILADTRITGKYSVGGIAGFVGIFNEESGGTVENCHVLSNVTVHAVRSNASDYGGIAGANWGTVTGCTSAAAVTTAEGIFTCYYYGGIVGDNNGPISDCIYLGSNLGGNCLVGAIAGVNDDDGNVSNCYFTSTTITGKNYDGLDLDNANSAVGENDATVETNVGLAPQDTKDNSGFLTLMAARNAALTAVERTTPLSTAIDVTLNGRTLYKDGAWNTLCLPFAVSTTSGPLAGDNVQAMTLDADNSGLSGTTLTLNFTSATSIPAGTPFIIKWDKATGYDDADPDTRDLKDPVFTGVTIDKTMHDVEFTGGSFKGTYTPIEYPTENTSILLLGTNSTLYWPKPGTDPDTGNPVYPRIGACRAYFDLGSNTAREFKLNFGDGNGSADVSSAIIADGDPPAPRGWYTLDGRKLDGVGAGPVPARLRKGLYIHNGKKVVIK